MKPKFIISFRLASGRCDMLRAQTEAELLELIRDLPRDAELYGKIGRRTLP
jgi:hypothetical protein